MKNNKNKDLMELFKKYMYGMYKFTIKINNDVLAPLLNAGAPRKITLSNGKEYMSSLMYKGTDNGNSYGIYKISVDTQRLTFEEFEELYNSMDNKEED